jgi:light-regulated signal transduction histidine kinase (bacteriophytochrome)/CheY-like chemotaxis protein
VKQPETKTDIDLTNCDREPIQFLGRVQDFGCLITVSSDWIILHASTNVDAILGLKACDLIGRRFADFFPGETIHHLRSRFQVLAGQKGAARLYGLDVLGNGRLHDVAVHRSNRQLVLEFLTRQDAPETRDDTALVQALIARVQRHKTIERATEEAARGVQALTGTNRVMVYRFEADASGTVVAEALRGMAEPYLGLRYPASDIPKQARELYKRNLIRVISDVDAPSHPIQPTQSPEGELLDLSLAVTRAVSPIHLEYLRNMGVKASMSVSILRKGELWGLFACHHDTPILIDYERRSAIELFAQLFAYELAQIETAAELQDIDRAREMHDHIMTQISSGESLIGLFETLADELEPVIPFDGIAVMADGVFRAQGSTPTEEEFLGLSRFLNTIQGSDVFSTDEIGAVYDKAESFADRAAGMLALPISRRPRDYLVLFRREQVSTVTWAGNPEKPVSLGPNGARLTPRQSFAAWAEVVRGKSRAWKERELRAASALRVTLLEVVLKLTDEANATRKRAEEQQEMLIAELNHRVRNILNLIRGLVSQGKGGSASVEDYSKVLDHRIHALARAHDQLTQQDWGWVALNALIETEAEAFLAGRTDRVRITGETISLSPQAFTTMALVMHELVTNSAKYGALRADHGAVLIDVQLSTDGAVTIDWREIGGPPVKAPTRKGFGTTIIHHSVPFDLKGAAEVHYRITGVEARFTLPPYHFERATAAPVAIKRAAEPEAPVFDRITGAVLLVEDNLIIAMDAADMLADLGADPVQTASSVHEAMKLLNDGRFAFAVLDVNLGTELSLPVARRCAELGIPAILATGYGAEGDHLTDFPKSTILRKPYTLEMLRRAIATALEG